MALTQEFSFESITGAKSATGPFVRADGNVVHQFPIGVRSVRRAAVGRSPVMPVVANGAAHHFQLHFVINAIGACRISLSGKRVVFRKRNAVSSFDPIGVRPATRALSARLGINKV